MVASNIAGRNSRKYVVVHIDNTNTVINDEKSNIADILLYFVCGVLRYTAGLSSNIDTRSLVIVFAVRIYVTL